MTKEKTYNLTEAAALLNVTYQAVKSRYGNRYALKDAPKRSRFAIPESALREWRKERHARARKLLGEEGTP